MICRKCGIENKENAVFCRQCGARLDGTVKRGYKKIAVSIVMAVVLVSAVSAFIYSRSSKKIQLAGKYSEGMIAIQQEDKYGFMDNEGNIVIPCIYDEVYSSDNGIAQGKIDGAWHEIQNPVERKDMVSWYLSDTDYTLGGCFAEQDSTGNWKLGIKDGAGNVVLPCIVDPQHDGLDGVYCVQKKDSNGNTKYGYGVWNYDKEDFMVYEWWDCPLIFSDGLAKVVTKNAQNEYKFGYVNESGEQVIPCVFDYAEECSEGLAFVGKIKAGETGWGYIGKRYNFTAIQYGYIDKQGQEVIPCIYECANDFSEDFVCVARKNAEGDGKYGYIDKQGQEVIPCIYDYANDFMEGLACVARKNAEGDRKYGYIDKQGQEVIPCIYDYANDFMEGLACVVRKNAEGEWKYGYIDKQGQEVIPCIYDYANDFMEGLACVARKNAEGDRKYGYIDKQGQEVIPCIYDNANDFMEGLACVVRKNAEGEWKYGYIDKQGQEVIPCIYDNANDFMEGLACVVRKNAEGEWKYGYIDKQGQEVIPPLIYDICGGSESRNGMIFVNKNTEEGTEMGYFLNPVQCVDKQAIPVGEGYFLWCENNKLGPFLEGATGHEIVYFDDSLSKCNKYYAKGMSYLEKGKEKKAKDFFEKALKEQPDNPYILQKLKEVQ